MRAIHRGSTPRVVPPPLVLDSGDMDPASRALTITAIFGIVVLWVFYFVRADWRAERQPCICRHARKLHVSALDWDSDYGNPGRMGGVAATYRKPGTCRDQHCLCQCFIADYRAKP
jgi:hypothetical protein